MRLEAAIPLLAEKLRGDSGNELNEQCLRGFVRVGTDAAVETICGNWHAEPWHYRAYAAAALKNIRCDIVASRCLDLAQREESNSVRCNLIATALHNFVSDGIEPARKFTLRWGLDLRQQLVAAAVLAGSTFPELDKWFKEESRNAQHDNVPDKKSTGQYHRLPQSTPKPLPPAFEDLLKPTPSAPIVGKKTVGRNDPCPCKSGRKYKKCCGKDA
jgi:hypothetical protein